MQKAHSVRFPRGLLKVLGFWLDSELDYYGITFVRFRIDCTRTLGSCKSIEFHRTQSEMFKEKSFSEYLYLLLSICFNRRSI